ncbi:MAG: phosphodiester glycosidase family protein [Thermoleophilaceae bacterium]
MGQGRGSPAIRAAPPRVRSFRHPLRGRAATTVHVAEYPQADWSARVVALDPPQQLAAWCARAGEAEAIVGGFFVRPRGTPLGELWIAGERTASEPFAPPRGPRRSCVLIDERGVRVAPRPELPRRPRGDLLQAGPLLVADGATVVGRDPEGFSSGAGQFDSDITRGRYPRAALGVRDGAVIALACDGRSDADAGLTLAELASLMLRLGADAAVNLDGGGSTSLVSGGELVNTPREEHGIELVAGRPVSTAIVFTGRP